MFSHELSENTELRLLEERHAQELSDLTDRNREHLRTWLPWVDSSRTVEDREKFIRDSLGQFAENKGFVAGFWHEVTAAFIPWYGEPTLTPASARTMRLTGAQCLPGCPACVPGNPASPMNQSAGASPADDLRSTLVFPQASFREPLPSDSKFQYS